MIIHRGICIMKGGLYVNTRVLEHKNALSIQDTLLVSAKIYYLIRELIKSPVAVNEIISSLTIQKAL